MTDSKVRDIEITKTKQNIMQKLNCAQEIPSVAVKNLAEDR